MCLLIISGSHGCVRKCIILNCELGLDRHYVVLSRNVTSIVLLLAKFVRSSGFLKCGNNALESNYTKEPLNRRKYRDITRQTFDEVRQYRLVLRHFGTRHSSPIRKFHLNRATSPSHHKVTRSLPGVISRRSMHRECLRRVCTSLFGKPFRQSVVFRARFICSTLYIRDRGNVSPRARASDVRAEIERYQTFVDISAWHNINLKIKFENWSRNPGGNPSFQAVVDTVILDILGVLCWETFDSLTLPAYSLDSFLLYVFDNVLALPRDLSVLSDGNAPTPVLNWISRGGSKYRGLEEPVFVCILRAKRLETLSSSRNCWKYMKSQRVTCFVAATSWVSSRSYFQFKHLSL